MKRGPAIALGVYVAALTLYANLALWVEDPALLRFFPPFRAGLNLNANAHLGAEYWSIAQALVAGRGFADPFFVASGPTAWMPPLYPLFLAALLWLFGSQSGVVAAVLVAKSVTLLLTGWVVVRGARRGARRLPPELALAGFALWITVHFAWFFQLTHDVWWILLWVDAILLGAWWLEDHDATPRATFGWGALGGVTALSSPVAAAGWAVLTLWLGWRRRALGFVAGAAALAMLVTSVWVVRNAVVFDELILVKSNFAFDFYQANFVHHDGVYDEIFFRSHPVWTSARDPRSTYRREGERAFLREYESKLGESLRARPGEWLRRSGRRLLAATLVYKPYRPTIEGRHPPLRTLVSALPFLGLALLWVLRRGSLHPSQRSASWLYLAYLTPYVLAAYYVRYLLPLTPVLVLLAFWGSDAVCQRWLPGDSAAEARRDAAR